MRLPVWKRVFWTYVGSSGRDVMGIEELCVSLRIFFLLAMPFLAFVETSSGERGRVGSLKRRSLGASGVRTKESNTRDQRAIEKIGSEMQRQISSAQIRSSVVWRLRALESVRGMLMIVNRSPKRK
jgi:hypothetical protein